MPLDELSPSDDGGGGGGPPPTSSGDWARIADLVAGRTEYNVTNFIGTNEAGTANLNGTYPVGGVTPDTITLISPEAINPNWDDIVVESAATNAVLSTNGDHWIGGFIVDLADLDKVINNFIAPAGIYKINKKGKQYSFHVNLLVELRAVDSDGDVVGPAENFTITLIGSSTEKTEVNRTLDAVPSSPGRVRVRARRTSPTELDYDGTLVDEVKWRDAYGSADVADIAFGDVTTVLVKSYATTGATSEKKRKFNLLARRRLPSRVAGDEFTTELTGTDRVDDIMSAITLDPYIGNYPLELVDFDNIYDTVQEIEDYFGSELAVEFGFTFDDDNVSFEETLQTVATCCFSTAYRQGSLIRLHFERMQDSGVLLFNHRNVLPRTQERTRTFGIVDDHDGVEFDWTAARDGAKLTYDIPYDRSAVSPRKAEVSGVRSGALAFWHSWRTWYRLKFQNATLTQECTQEAALVMPADRVLITDLTRPPGFEGDVLSATGLDLTLSQPTTFAPDVSHVIFIQHIDATTEALVVGPWVPPPGEEEDPYRVTLATAPRLDLALGEGLSARPTYEIVPETDKRPRSWLVTEREPNTDFTESLSAINYSPMYYINDNIVLWLPLTEPACRDQSPNLRDGVLLGTGAVINDVDRGKLVYSGTAVDSRVTFAAFDPPASYSKSAWVKASAGNVLTTTTETFGFSGGNFVASNGAGGVSVAAPPSGEWHLLTATYDQPSEVMSLYLDGELVDEATGIARGALSQLVAFRDLIGRADDLRLWNRALTAETVAAYYRSSLRPTV